MGKFVLLDAPRSGGPSSISPALRDFVEKIARSDTALYSTVFTNWSLQNIHRYLKEVFKENVSKSNIYHILKSSGFHFRMITETLVTNDPKYTLKKQRLQSAEAEATADASVELLYLDEKGPVHALFYRFKKWLQRPLEIAKNLNRSNGKVVLNAAFNKNLNKFWWHFSEKRNSEAFLLLLHQLSLDETLQNLRKVYLVVDNLANHFIQSVQDFLALHPQFELLRLPIYSPELSLIECVIGNLDSMCNLFFQSAQELMARISNWFLDRMKRPAPELKTVPKKKL